MKKLTLLFLLGMAMLCPGLQAQSYSSLENARRLLAAEQYDSAMALFEAVRHNAIPDTAAAGAIGLGSCYLDQYNYPPAIPILSEAITKSTTGSALQAEAMQTLGLAYIQKGDIDSAFYWLGEARSRISETDTLQRFRIELFRGMAYQSNEDFADAYKSLHQAESLSHSASSYLKAIYYAKLGNACRSLGWIRLQKAATRRMLDHLEKIPLQSVRWGHVLTEGGNLILDKATADSMARRLDNIFALRLGPESVARAYSLGWLSGFAPNDSVKIAALEHKSAILFKHLGPSSSPYINNLMTMFWAESRAGLKGKAQLSLQNAEVLINKAPNWLRQATQPTFQIYKSMYFQFLSPDIDSAISFLQAARIALATKHGEASITATATCGSEANLYFLKRDTAKAIQLINTRKNAIFDQAGDSSALLIECYENIAIGFRKLGKLYEAQSEWEKVDLLNQEIFGPSSINRETSLFNCAFTLFQEEPLKTIKYLKELKKLVENTPELTKKDRVEKKRNVYKYVYFYYKVYGQPDSANYYFAKWQDLVDQNDPNYLNDLINQATFNQMFGNWAKYEQEMETALRQYNANLAKGIRNIQVESFLFDALGDYYCTKGLCDSAAICYKKYAELTIQQRGKNDITLNIDIFENDLTLAQCRNVSIDSIICLRAQVVKYHTIYNSIDLNRLLMEINALAQAYRTKGDFSVYQLYCRQALALQDSLCRRHPEDYRIAINYLTNKAYYYNTIGIPDSALAQFNRAIEIGGKYGVSKDSFNLDIALILFQQNKFDEAVALLKKGIAIDTQPADPRNLGYRLNRLAWLGYLLCILKDKTLLADITTSIKNQIADIKDDQAQVIDFYKDIAVFLRHLNDQEQSVQMAKEGLRLSNALQSTASIAPLSIAGKSATIPKLFDQAAQSYRLWFEQSQQHSYLDSAALYANYAVDAQEIQENFSGGANPEVSIYLRKNAGNFFYEEAIRAALAYERIDHNLAQKRKAFEFSERSKAAVFRQLLQKQRSAVQAGIAPELLKAEQQTEQQIRALEVSRFKMQQNAQAHHLNAADDLGPRLLRLYTRRDSIGEIIRKRYPDYYALLYRQEVISVGEVQNHLLKSGQTLLEYFLTDSLLTIFVIRSDTFHVYSHKPDPHLGDQLDAFLHELRQSNPIMPTLLSSGRYLYRQLLEPVESLLTPELLVIPSGKLYLVPFEALLTNDQVMVDNKERPWLIRKHTLRYAVSATVLRQQTSSRPHNLSKSERLFVGFAPTYARLEENPEWKSWGTEPIADTRGSIRDLKWNAVEIDDIATGIGPNIPQKILRRGRQATRLQFEKDCEKAWILHFAGHAKSYDRSGQFSFLLFSFLNGPLDSIRLFAREVYGLRLKNTEMVVLSGCETGLGNVETGEGVIGLGRAFAYAGARSLAFSLWDLSDYDAGTMMPDFYQNLGKGLNKADALRRAKLHLLDQNKVPFFWAPFVLYGDASQIF